MAKTEELLVTAGQWRPHYQWEQIAWIRPPWPNDDYLWLDFPEAIFTDQGLFYLSHTNDSFPPVFPELPPVLWAQNEATIHYERRLPNGLHWEGWVSAAAPALIQLQLCLTNGTERPLTNIQLQTCLFMRAYYQLSEYTLLNKYVHTAEQGWLTLQEAQKVTAATGRYRLGWRDGSAVADLPVIACQTDSPGRLVAFSWGADTYSLVSNPDHPCIHADPVMPDLAPGESYTLNGEIFFANDGLAELLDRYTT